ncbi:hypothetical protein Q4485_04800 [Granulosicoccaceae sp. 1_MG-2023]|nr:hypothetical protein [Granulosicoccaceae sp. 1_MG-2023]
MSGNLTISQKQRLTEKQLERQRLREEMRQLQAEMDFLCDVLIFKQQRLRCLNRDIACLSRLLPVLNVLPAPCGACPPEPQARRSGTPHLFCVK